jgi:8-oxo-dGTP diphosphatase
MKRRYPHHPVVGIGALVQRQGRILLVRRGGEPGLGLWSLPGGVLEPGEMLENGVRREVFEETGLTVQTVRLFDVFERILRDKKDRLEYHYVLLDYLCRVTGGELKPGGDASDAAWVRREELARRPMTEGTLDVILRAFRASQRAK